MDLESLVANVWLTSFLQLPPPTMNDLNALKISNAVWCLNRQLLFGLSGALSSGTAPALGVTHPGIY